ncbi:flagellar biosynthesis protein FlhB [Sediminispirochaeta bajacaliforniensis]|nr:flagellar biosynthesis protein FlhB [Sediminispirochaeta bajacaliforniensis]
MMEVLLRPFGTPFAESRWNIDLQWFAAEDEGRTEDPTEQKIRKAREEGKVAKSAEFTSSLVLLFPIVALGILAPRMFGTMEEMLRYYLSLLSEGTLAAEQVWAFFRYFIRLVAPVAGVAVAAALFGNVIQVGFLFTSKPITPDFSKIVPRFGKFIQRSFLSGEALFNLMKSILKVLIIGIIAYINIRNNLDIFAFFVNAPFEVAFSTIGSVAFKILVESSIALLALSLPDYLFQRRQHRESLKMTKQEIKEERKTMEGDPLIKSRLKERMRDVLNRDMIRKVPEADVIITNPTHFAVGMEWERERMVAPMVIAKGQDNMAQRIKAIAREHDVPIVENKPLARALYAEVEVGEVIPERYYEVMATILAEVYRVNGGSKVS